MDEFYLQNTTRYQALVKAVKPPSSGKDGDTVSNTDLREAHMVVSARIRPLLEEDLVAGFPRAVFQRHSDSGSVDIHDLYNHPKGRPILKSSEYRVDRVFNSDATTEEIYNELVAGLIPVAWNGGIGTLFAYGQTGSGKTFTISRLEQLAIASLLRGKLDGKRQLYITIVELAGNAAHDLLNSRKKISVLQDSFGATQLAGAHEHLLESTEQAAEFVERAASLRRTESTLKNDNSSRSHGICRLRIKDTVTGTEGFLYLVDLAGSEAARDMAAHGADRMRETREINMSLSVLKDCIRGKAQWDNAVTSTSDNKSRHPKKKPHVPFRQSALTKVLKHVFDPHDGRVTKTRIVACVNPSLADAAPSKNTLRYAEMLCGLATTTQKPAYDPKVPMTWSNAQLKEWITNNSGTPPIPAAVVDPNESGSALLRISAKELEHRWIEIEGSDVSREKVEALCAKLWRLHVDSQHGKTASKVSSAADVTATDSNGAAKVSSQDLSPAAASTPFKKRIRPGMVVSWTKPDRLHRESVATGDGDEKRLAVLLCPTGVLGKASQNGTETPTVVPPSQHEHTAWLCTLVRPGLMNGSYEVILWENEVVQLEWMMEEVILEYDTATRYYHISI